MAKQRGLGKGLASLIPASPEAPQELHPEEKTATSQTLAATLDLHPNPFQPRKTINEELLKNLADSISEHGIIQPVLVRPSSNGYQIVAGERRWRAAQLAGLKEIPIRVLEITDAQAMELALVENLQREDLSTVEVALGIQELIAKLSLTHEEVAEKIGISRAAVTNKLRLLQLPESVIAMLENDELTEGHARALLSLSSVEKILEFANTTVQKNLSVRQLEQLVRNVAIAAKIDAALPRKAAMPTDFQDEIDRIHKNLKLTVRIAGNRKNMGLLIKGLKKWQVQLLLEYLENNSEELFPRE
ncbi:ParB/RepB/Spo0J family partition protein [Synergistaceae bacterium OttesenSCG-928-I11]|nr:ParB/RepB/Spo0J family partition protein [Synergistaceae bacterium OttesenSCG-928-I11]